MCIHNVKINKCKTACDFLYKKKPTKYKPYVTLGNFTFSFYSIFICKKFFKYSLYKKLVIMRTETSIVNMQDWSLHTIILVAVITTTWGLSYYFSFGDKKPEHKSLKEYMPLLFTCWKLVLNHALCVHIFHCSLPKCSLIQLMQYFPFLLKAV